MHSGKISVLIAGLLIGVFLTYLGCGPVAAAEQDNFQVRVMSFNIRYGSANDGQNSWPHRRKLVFDLIRRHDCDVVGLQEALGYQIREIMEAVPGYDLIGVAREDGKDEGEYSCILYRKDRFEAAKSGTFWFSDTPEVPGSRHWGNVCVRICSWARLVEKETGRAFYAYNLHLDHVSQPSREKSAILLAQRIAARPHSDPFVVTGDFNAAEQNPVIRYLKGEAPLKEQWGASRECPVPMVDTFRALHPDAARVGTFNGFDGKRDGGKIDFVLAQASTEVREAAILYDNADGRYPSDHFPILAVLEFPQADKIAARNSDTDDSQVR